MATQVYRVQGPDGRIYRLQGPANATPEEIAAVAEQQLGKFSQAREEPPVDAATENLDPRDVQARRRPAPATDFLGKLREVYNVGGMRGVVQGIRDPIDAGAQILVRGARAIGGADDAEVRRVDRLAEQANAQYLYDTGRQAGDLDVARLGGNVAATTAVLPARFLRGATVGSRAAGGAAIGAAGGALQPVTEGDFAGEKTKQVLLGAVAGGVGTPVTEGVLRAAVPAINQAANLIRRAGTALRPPQYDNLLAQSLEAQGIKWAELGDEVRNALRQDVVSALKAGGQVDGEAIRRLADIRSVGATPTRGSVTLDPVQITAERNLAKAGANSTDPTLQRLSQVESENNRALIDRLNKLQGGSSADEFSTGALTIRALQGRDEQAANTVRDLYRRAEDMNAGSITLDGAGFVNVASRALDDSRRGAFLPAQVRSVMQEIADRQQRGIQMTLNDVEQLRTILAAEARKASRSGDGNAQAAIGVVRDALEGTPTDSLRGEAANAAFNRARAAHRARMKLREESPALDAALNGAEPDQFVRKFITGQGASVADVNALRRSLAGDPDALDAVRGQIINHLKSRATGGASDEVATISQKRLNDAINAIGDRKLSAFFSPEEIAQIRQVGRVASYLQVQPKGSAVNNSNTASAAFGVLDRILSRVPFGDAAIRTPLQNFSQQREARNALLQTLPVTVDDLINDAARNRLVRLVAPVGGALGVMASAQ
jgi:hypothetical protein